MSMALRNLIAAVALLLLTGVYGYLTSELPDRLEHRVPGPSFFPALIAGALGLLSLALLVKAVVQARREGWTLDGISVPGRELLTLVWFTGFVAALPWAGFVPAGVPFFAGMVLIHGERRLHWVVLGAVAVPLALYYLFREAFQIVLPAGPWGF